MTAPEPPPPVPGVLTHQDIIDLCDFTEDPDESVGEKGPVRPCRRDNVRSASYDLRLGKEYYQRDGKAGGKRWGKNPLLVSALEPGKSEGITIPPNGLVIVTALERIDLPSDMVGHLTLKVSLLMRGLMMASQSQIDAGYRGWVWGLLYNLSGEPRTLKYGDSIFRLELVRLAKATSRPYHEGFEDKTLSQVLKEPVSSTLEHVSGRVEGIEKRVTRTQVAAAVLGVAVTAAGILGAYVGYLRDADAVKVRADRVPALEARLGEANGTITSLQRQIEQLRTRIQDVEAKRP